jgi:predicted dienelactone hydrolase
VKLAVRIIGGLVVLLAASLALYLYSTALRPSRPVGFQQMTAVDPGHRRIPIAIWYPTKAKPGFVLLGTRGMRVASDAPVDGNRLPLVVMSHGTGGSAISHADTAISLAGYGFVVAAPTHPGDNLQDSSEVGRPHWLVDRTRHLSKTIDAILDLWKDRAHVDPTRVGVFGFSAGATTALISVGGRPDLSRIATECRTRPEFVCKITSPASYQNFPNVAWNSDSRIRAAVLAAPGLGFTFAPNGLSQVRVPVQLWAGEADQTVPLATNAGLVERLLPNGAEVHIVPGAVHYSFLMPCGVIGPPQLCHDPNGFNREDFHRQFNDAVVRFFQQHLSNSANR